MFKFKYLQLPGCGILVLAICLIAFSQGRRSSTSSDINWSGIREPFRFGSYCSPRVEVHWSAAGLATVTFQKYENGIYETRQFKLIPGDVPPSFYGIWFDTSGRGWVIGDYGYIFHTNDNGNSWQRQESRTNANLRAITCVDSRSCWAVGIERTLLRTNNSGDTWEHLNNVGGDVVDFVSTSTGWVADGDNLFQTRDGGKSWKILVNDGGADYIYAGLFVHIKFINESVGWAAGDEKLGYTTDGGKTWSLTKISDGDFVAVVASDGDNALAVNRGEFNYCTTNAGKKWERCFPKKRQ